VTPLRSVTQAAEDLGLSVPSVRRLAASGVLPHIRLGGRVLFDPGDIATLIDENRVVRQKTERAHDSVGAAR